MSTGNDELHLELLLGVRVLDSEGCVAGRVEEFRAEQLDGEWVITEFHLGTAALLERLAIAVSRLPLISSLPWKARQIRCVPWDRMEFDDRGRPRLGVPAGQLRTLTPR